VYKVNLNGVQSKLQSESAWINWIQDQRYAAVSSLKARVDLINDKVKDNEPFYKRLETMTSSCTTFVTDIRKKLNNLEKKVESHDMTKDK
jgi:predicted nuclease with TOPRIM domain